MMGNINLNQNNNLSVMLKRNLEAHKIPNYFIPYLNLDLTTLLVASNCILLIGKSVLIVSATSTIIRCQELKFTLAGYEFIRSDQIIIDENTNNENLRDQILQTSTPTKIILWDKSPSKSNLAEILKSKNLTHFTKSPSDYYGKVLPEICGWFFNKSNVKFHILPIFNKTFEFWVSYGCQEEKIMAVDYLKKIPFSKYVAIPRTVFECYARFGEQKNFHNEGKKMAPNYSLLLNKCHYLILQCITEKKNGRIPTQIVIVDKNNFERYNFVMFFELKINHLPMNLNHKTKFSIPVIGIWKDSSVILCWDKDDGYDFLESWGGVYGEDLLISFDAKKPKYGKEAWKVLGKKPGCVVYDLISIMSKPIEEIEDNKKWGFKISKSDPDFPILIGFQNFDGTRKSQTPAFLMAMLLKLHVRKIKEKIGKKPAKIGFHVIDDFTNDEMQRIHARMKEACDLLKIKFVPILKEMF